VSVKIGEMFITGVTGLELSIEEKKFIQQSYIGGVILFKHNYHSPAQLADLINNIQSLRDEYPLIIAVDQEGGRVKRFGEPFGNFPPMFTLGEIDSPKLTYEVHLAIAQELRVVGVNLNLSPVCDILYNENNKVIGDRAFAREREKVEKQISAAIRGLHSGGISACAKHFPGHGSTSKDSHFDLPFLKKNLDELKNEDLSPFLKATKSRVEFIMMAHLVVDAIDNEYPSSLSEKTYMFLREFLNYDKLIITDDMEMKAITDHFGFEESILLAINGGANLLEYRSFDKTLEAYEIAMKAYKEKKLKKEKIADSLNRLLKFKKKNFLDYRPVQLTEVMANIKKSNSSEIIDKIHKTIKIQN
jgi:beta-N-acetylhexosaminidase